MGSAKYAIDGFNRGFGLGLASGPRGEDREEKRRIASAIKDAKENSYGLNYPTDGIGPPEKGEFSFSKFARNAGDVYANEGDVSGASALYDMADKRDRQSWVQDIATGLSKLKLTGDPSYLVKSYNNRFPDGRRLSITRKGDQYLVSGEKGQKPMSQDQLFSMFRTMAVKPDDFLTKDTPSWQYSDGIMYDKNSPVPTVIPVSSSKADRENREWERKLDSDTAGYIKAMYTNDMGVISDPDQYANALAVAKEYRGKGFNSVESAYKAREDAQKGVWPSFAHKDTEVGGIRYKQYGKAMDEEGNPKPLLAEIPRPAIQPPANREEYFQILRNAPENRELSDGALWIRVDQKMPDRGYARGLRRQEDIESERFNASPAAIDRDIAATPARREQQVEAMGRQFGIRPNISPQERGGEYARMAMAETSVKQAIDRGIVPDKNDLVVAINFLKGKNDLQGVEELNRILTQYYR